MSNFKVHNPEIEEHIRKVGRLIKDSMPDGWGFTVLMFDLNTTKGSMFYLSSAERKSMIEAMEEFIAKNK